MSQDFSFIKRNGILVKVSNCCIENFKPMNTEGFFVDTEKLFLKRDLSRKAYNEISNTHCVDNIFYRIYKLEKACEFIYSKLSRSFDITLCLRYLNDNKFPAFAFVEYIEIKIYELLSSLNNNQRNSLFYEDCRESESLFNIYIYYNKLLLRYK